MSVFGTTGVYSPPLHEDFIFVAKVFSEIYWLPQFFEIAVIWDVQTPNFQCHYQFTDQDLTGNLHFHCGFAMMNDVNSPRHQLGPLTLPATIPDEEKKLT